MILEVEEVFLEGKVMAMVVIQVKVDLDQGHLDLAHTQVDHVLEVGGQNRSPQDKENQDQSQIKKENQVVQNQIQEKEKQVVLVLDRILGRKIESQLVPFHQEKGVSLEELQKILKAVVLVLHLCGVRVLRRNNKNLKSKSQSLINKTLKQNLLKYCKKLKKNKKNHKNSR